MARSSAAWAFLTLALGSAPSLANHPLIVVPGLTGSGLEVKEDGAVMPHRWCSTDMDWTKVWVSPVPWHALRLRPSKAPLSKVPYRI